MSIQKGSTPLSKAGGVTKTQNRVQSKLETANYLHSMAKEREATLSYDQEKLFGEAEKIRLREACVSGSVADIRACLEDVGKGPDEASRVDVNCILFKVRSSLS